MESLLSKLLLVVVTVTTVASLPVVRNNSNYRISSLPDERAGKSLNVWEESEKVGNPEEQGTYFEGDIINIEARNDVDLDSRMWKDGIIPYELRGSFCKLILLNLIFSIHHFYNFKAQKDKNLLSDAIEEFEKVSCIKFIPRAAEKDYIAFDNKRTGCWSHVGKIGGPQVVNYQTPGCMTKVGTVIHEILHALGFYHEQSRFDRDNYVKINFRNIPNDKVVNFEKMPKDDSKTFNVKYDMRSVLHYSAYAFSKNNKMTIESRSDKSLNKVMGQREGFSENDIEKLNTMYCSK